MEGQFTSGDAGVGGAASASILDAKRPTEYMLVHLRATRLL